MKLFPLLMLAALSVSCAKSQNLETVPQVDIERYLGLWYEIASIPARFQKGCRCSTAEYQQVEGKGYIRVINQCNKIKNERSIIAVATGKAFPVEGSGNARLKVQFFWPFKGDYYIIELADDYTYAVVGHPSRSYLWILSRESTMPVAVYSMLIEKIGQKGFDVSRLQKTGVNCHNPS